MKYVLKAKKYGKWITVQTSSKLSNISIPKKKVGWIYKVVTIPKEKIK